MDAQGQVLVEADARRLVNLLGKAATVSEDIVVKRRFLMEGVGAMVGADFWGWCHCRGLRDSFMPVAFNVLSSPIEDPALFNRLVAVTADVEAPVPEYVELRKIPEKHITRLRQELISDEAFYQSKSWVKHRQFCGFDQSLVSVMQVAEPDTWSLLVFYKEKGREAFSLRDKFIAHVVTSEVEWLHFTGVENPNKEHVGKLTPRQRQVLFCLLNGQNPKEIAKNMRLSEHTVRDHVQAIYGHFGCSGRSELFAKFLGGAA